MWKVVGLMRWNLGDALSLMGFGYCLFNVFERFGGCASLGCQAVQHPALWFVGMAYCLFLPAARRMAPRFWAWGVFAGALVEGALVLYQVLLGLYCRECLVFTSIFVAYLILVPALPLRVRAAAFGTALSVAALSAGLLAVMNCGVLCDNPAVDRIEEVAGRNPVVVFEPLCSQCHEFLRILDTAGLGDQVDLCPQAWSFDAVVKLARENCNDKNFVKCLFAHLAIVRDNNRYCSKKGWEAVPFLITRDGRAVSTSEGLAYLALTGAPDLWGWEVGGSCTPGAKPADGEVCR